MWREARHASHILQLQWLSKMLSDVVYGPVDPVYVVEIRKIWLILRNGYATIGLFQGMFEQNILTFNPGWDAQAKNLEDFTDVREIQKALKSNGIQLTTEADDASTGPASVTMLDPDGNPVLINQHV